MPKYSPNSTAPPMSARTNAHQSPSMAESRASRTASTGYDGSTIAVGSRRQSRSMRASAMPMAPKYRYAGRALGSLIAMASRTNRIAVNASTSGYRTEMGAPQDAQPPRNMSHPSTGMLC